MKLACVTSGFLLASMTGVAQQYVISTYAGGAAFPTPNPAVAGSIGAPFGVATDQQGNVFFASPDINSVFQA